MKGIPNYSFQVSWSDEDEGYIALCPEFPTLSAFGESAEEAVVELQEAIAGAIEILEEEGQSIPSPRSIPVYSGQFRLRLPKSLHGQLAQHADAEGVSLNTLALTYISHGLGADFGISSVREELTRVAQTWLGTARAMRDLFHFEYSRSEAANRSLGGAGGLLRDEAVRSATVRIERSH